MRRGTRWLVGLAALGLVASGCGGASGEEAGSSDTTAAEEQPKAGGKAVYALVSDADGWSPATSRWTPGGLDIARAVYDPLAAFDADGVPQPYLAESIEPNDHFTVWTITLRDGIRFHNGDPLTADIVAQNLEAVKASALIGPTLKLVSAIDAPNELEVVVTMSEPWSSFPVLIAQQPGFIAHPSVLAGETSEPIGTGPFAYESWTPGDTFTATRNADYWQTDDEGTALPYLNEVEFRVIAEASTRESALAAGDVDLMQTNAATTLVSYGRELDVGKGFYAISTPDSTDEQLVALNTQTGSTDDPVFRQAIAMATDREALNDQLYEGFFTVADTPFPDDSPWASDPGWPAFDPDRARELVTQVQQAGGDTQVNLSVGADTESLALGQAVEQQWEAVGIDTQIQSLDATALTLDMVTGQFEAALIALFNSPDPDGDYHFLDPTNRAEPGEFSLDFTRYHSPELKANMDAARLTSDRVARADEYAKVWAEIAETVPLIWMWHTQFVIVASDSVQGLDDMVLPSGDPIQLVNWGSIFLTRAWQRG